MAGHGDGGTGIGPGGVRDPLTKTRIELLSARGVPALAQAGHVVPATVAIMHR